MNDGKIRVLIAGICGRMGQETAKAVYGADDMQIVGACDVTDVGCDVRTVLPTLRETDAVIQGDLCDAIDETRPDVVVDFTSPSSVMSNIRTSLERGVPIVVGTTGITQENLEELRALSAKVGTPALIAPNFAIGAVLMMKFAAEAAKYLPSVEIIELHHDKKLDAPSGTSIKTAEMIARTRGVGREGEAPAEPSPRGQEFFGVPIHSVRLQGFVAHQEVIFGGLGQTLTIRHDSIDRTSFMPGVLMAIRKVRGLNGIVYGLENLL
jgi:4-hydroxy-tetrahydrodipicolinate reductase